MSIDPKRLTVADYIAELQKFPPETVCYVYDWEVGMFDPARGPVCKLIGVRYHPDDTAKEWPIYESAEGRHDWRQVEQFYGVIFH